VYKRQEYGEALYKIFRTAACESMLLPTGNKAASPNLMAHWAFLTGWPPLVLASQNFPAAFAIFGHAGTLCLIAGALQQDSKRRQCKENLIQHLTICYSHFLSQQLQKNSIVEFMITRRVAVHIKMNCHSQAVDKVKNFELHKCCKTEVDVFRMAVPLG
jgi:hypothetical protein